MVFSCVASRNKREVEAADSECREAPPARRTRSRHGGQPLLQSSRAAALKRETVKMHLCVLTRFPQARENAAERKRSRSEADTGRRTGLCLGLCLFFRRENRLRFSRRAGPSCWSCFCGSSNRRACALGLWPTRGARSPNPTELGRRMGTLLLRPFGSPGPDACPRAARKLTRFVAFRPSVRPASFANEYIKGRSQRGRKRASRSCRPTPGVAPARAILRTAGVSSKRKQE